VTERLNSIYKGSLVLALCVWSQASSVTQYVIPAKRKETRKMWREIEWRKSGAKKAQGLNKREMPGGVSQF